MKYSELRQYLISQKNWTEDTKPVPILKKILNIPKEKENKLYKRIERDSDFTDGEIALIKKYYQITDVSDDCVDFPVLGEVEASMGYGVQVYNEGQTGVYSISQQLVNDLGISKDNSEIIFGRGNSMEPTILGGDALLIDKTKTEVSDGRIYCIRYDGQLLTKRLQKLSKTKIKIISDNKDYEPITIELDKEPGNFFEVIGEVRWSGRVFR